MVFFIFVRQKSNPWLPRSVGWTTSLLRLTANKGNGRVQQQEAKVECSRNISVVPHDIFLLPFFFRQSFEEMWCVCSRYPGTVKWEHVRKQQQIMKIELPFNCVEGVHICYCRMFNLVRPFIVNRYKSYLSVVDFIRILESKNRRTHRFLFGKQVKPNLLVVFPG